MDTVIKMVNVESDVNNKLISKVDTGMNRLVRSIKAVGVNKTGLVAIEFKSSKVLYIDYIKNTYSYSLKALKYCKPNYNYIKGNQKRLTIVLPITLSGSRFQIALLVALANELYHGIVRSDYDGLSCNHKDCSGNYNRYGYINNRLDNLEIVDGGDNKRHERKVYWVEKICNKHISISAVDPMLYYISSLDKDELIEFFNNKGKKYVVQ
jgi:hypothetical protein